jgi:hypothetical protein
LPIISKIADYWSSEMSKVKNNDQNTYTFDEYTRKFFPSKARGLQMEMDSPNEFGIKLANETLREIRQVLAKKQQK